MWKGIPCTLGAVFIASCSSGVFESYLTRRAQFVGEEQRVSEGAGEARVAVELNAAATSAVSIPFEVSGSATVGEDYLVGDSPLRFRKGQRHAEIPITLIDDAFDEEDEEIVFTLLPSFGVEISGAASRTFYLLDNEPTPTLSVTDVAANEADGTVQVDLTLSVPSSRPIGLTYQTEDGSAEAGSDYDAASGTLELAPGETVASLQIGLVDDAVFESEESFSVKLVTADGAVIGKESGLITITDDDGSPPTIDVAPSNASEAAGVLSFVVSVSPAASGPVSVDYMTLDGTAVADSDYFAAGGTLDFAAGETQKQVDVALIDDADVEGTEDLSLLLSNPSGASLGQERATGLIFDDDVIPEVNIADASVVESSGVLSLAVSLSEASGNTINVDFATADGTALAGSDYTATTGTLTFLPGETQKYIAVTLDDDAELEGSETFTVALTNPTAATLGVALATVTILDDEVVPTVSIDDVTASEAAGSVSFTVSLSEASGNSISVDFATADATATAGDDYVADAGTLTFNPGTTTQTLVVALVDDTLVEGSETFTVELTNPTFATLSKSTGTATLLDTDGVPALSVSDASASESDASMTFIVVLSQASGQEVTVDYTTSDGTAASGADFVATSGTLTFAPGQTTQIVSVDLLDDTLLERTETFYLLLSVAAGGVINDGSGTGSIFDDEVVPDLTIADASAAENAGSISFTVSLSEQTGNAVEVSFTTVDGSATAPADYEAATGLVSFAAGETQKTITIVIVDDTAPEGSEDFGVQLFAASGATLVDGAAIGVIYDDEIVPAVVINDVAAVESDGFLSFDVTLSAPTGNTVSLSYATADGTATSGSDYASDSGVVTFAPGQVSQQIVIVLFDDALLEGTETFDVQLSLVSGATLVDDVGTATLWDDEVVPTVSIADAAGSETDGSLTFTVSLSGATGASVSVNYASSDGSATAGSDYSAASGTVDFAPGELQKSLVVDLLDDSLDEDDETFSVALASPQGATLGTTPGSGTITDDDPTPTVAFSASSSSVSENVGTQLLEVSLSAPSGRAVSVPFSANGASTASSPADFGLSASPLVIPVGATSANISLDVVDDGDLESNETVIVDLGTPVAATLASPASHTVTIVDNDTPLGIVDARTLDADADGHIDHYVITFTEPVDDSSFPGYIADSIGTAQNDWLVAGHTDVVLAHGAAAPVADTPNDTVIYLRFAESSAYDTGELPDLTTSATPQLIAQSGSILLQVTSGSVLRKDGAPPLLYRASTEDGLSLLNVFFSEPVSNSGSCPGTVSASDFVYGGNGSGVVDITDGADANGCDGSVVLAAMTGVFDASLDIDADTIAPSAQVTDIDGNPARADAALVTGIIHPFVFSAVSTNADTARLEFSEPVDAAQATTIANYAYTAETCVDSPQITSITRLSDELYSFATSLQQNGCTYRLEVVGDVRDLDENATMTDPKYATFIGDESLKVMSAEARSLNSFVITFSKDVLASGVGGADDTSYYSISSQLGAVVEAVRYDAITGDPLDANKVRITHANYQGSAYYSVVVSTSLLSADASENLAANPFDRTTFLGLPGAVTSVDQGAFFEDPFGDGTTFSFVFTHGDKVYAGPNDSNSAVFRFDPNGSNPVTVTFSTTSGSSGGPYATFGNNLTRPVETVDSPAGAARYWLPPGTDLSAFAVGDPGIVTGCTVGTNNRASTISVLDDAGDTVTLSGVAGQADATCQITLYNNAGPDSTDGVDAFVSAVVSDGPGAGATDYAYLVFGPHQTTGANFRELYLTRDLDTVLDNTSCNIAGVTLGNSESLQTIYGYDDRLYFAFGSDHASKRPVLAHMAVTPAGCSGLTDQVNNGSGNSATAAGIPYIGVAGGNTALNVGIDSIVVFDDGTPRLYVANNGGVAATASLAPVNATWSDVQHDGKSVAGTVYWTGTTRPIPGTGKLRPGEKGVPFMVPWGGYLWIARNRSDNTAELWRYRAGAWVKALSTADTNLDNRAISMLVVNGSRLYVGFDNEVDGAEIWRSVAGVAAADLDTPAEFEAVGQPGLGPVGGADLAKNKHIISHASVTFVGKSYLYITVGCLSDFRDDGSCDRAYDPGLPRAQKSTDFAIRMFRQVD